MRRGRDTRESAGDSAGVVPVHNDDDDITVAVLLVVRERWIWPRDYSTAGESYKTHSAPARPVSVRH